MAGWFGSGTTAFDEQIEKATSSALEDMAANLEICDVIRSKQVPPKDAMRSLKRRIGNKNPNIQLATLQLTDACVKNGGSHFLQEIASREFIDNLVSLMNTPAQPLNLEVKLKMLELIQGWAIAFEGQPQLSYVPDTYRLLKREGYQFPPPPSQISKAFVDSSAPPEWADSDVCLGCRNAFTLMNRKHHCRNCGNVFCGTCSSKTLPLVHIGIPQAVRVCDGCHNKLTRKEISRPIMLPPQVQGRNFAQPGYMQPRDARVQDETGFDADLRMALKMSEEEAKGGKGTSGYVSQSQLKAMNENTKSDTKAAAAAATNATTATTTKPKQQTEEEEDDELKAAIAASIADMEEQKKKSAWNNPIAAASAQPATVSAVRPDYELTLSEAENINLLSTLVHKLQSQPPGAILREPAIQELYESVGKLRPKLARTFGETMSKYEALCDLHAKLATVVRYYDKMLEDRLSYTYSRHGLGTTSYAARPSYASVPQNAESFYGAQFSSPVPQAETPYSRPQSTYQVTPQHRQSQYQPTPSVQYAQPTAVASQESQKYNMYPSMPPSMPQPQQQQQQPGPYPTLTSPPPPTQQATAYPPQQVGYPNGQPVPTPQPQQERQPPTQTPQAEYPPSAYPSMPPSMPPQTPRTEYAPPLHQIPPQPTGSSQAPLSEAQTTSAPSYPPQDPYQQYQPPQQLPPQQSQSQPSYPSQDQPQAQQPPQQQQQQQQQQPQQYWQQQQYQHQHQPAPQEPSSTPSYPPPVQQWQPPPQGQVPPSHQPPQQQQQQPQPHAQVQESVSSDFYKSYPPQVQQQQQQIPQHAYYQQPVQKPIEQQPQPVVAENLIDL